MHLFFSFQYSAVRSIEVAILWVITTTQLTNKGIGQLAEAARNRACSNCSTIYDSGCELKLRTA